MVETPYRFKVGSDHFKLVRHFMVDRGIRSAGKAAEEMIELVAASSENEQVRREGVLLRSRKRAVSA